MKNVRIETLDWLRGLMALSIMLYHLNNWTYSPLDASSLLGRLGIYSVSIFFILSGLSMAIVYNSSIDTFQKSFNFYIRRIFRIWPLLWIICFATILPQITKTGIPFKLLFLNLTTLFGFIKPTAYIATGTWSIGNEMVYYALTPIIFFLYNYKKWVGNVFFFLCVSIGLFFAFNLLDKNIPLPKQWSVYVNPFNNFFLYVMGIAIFYNFKDLQIKLNLNLGLLFIAITLFSFIPFQGNQISIVTGIGRIVFSMLSFVIVLCFYKLDVNLPLLFSKPLETFGIATYGIYLIHPVVYLYCVYFFQKIQIENDFLLLAIVIVSTITLAILSYNFFELKFMKVGKKIVAFTTNKLDKRKKV